MTLQLFQPKDEKSNPFRLKLNRLIEAVNTLRSDVDAIPSVPDLSRLHKFIQCRSSDTSTNYNTNPAWTPVVWDIEDIKDSLFTHDNATNNTRITFPNAGKYLVTCSLAITATVNRPNLFLAIRLDGTTILPGLGAGGYIRNTDGHIESSVHFSRLIEVTANQYMEMITKLAAATGTVNLIANESVLLVESKI